MKDEKLQDNSFITTLNAIGRGQCVNELSEALAELVASVKKNKGSGELSLKLKLKPATGDSDTLALTYDVAKKMPKAPARGTIFYPTDSNTLSRNDPNQRELNLREVPKDEEARPLPAAAVR